MTLRPLHLAALCAAGLAAVALPSREAAACGGFFCNGPNPVPIYQAGERVLFARQGNTTTMHVEVAYSGAPTSFSWLLPLVQMPLGEDGQPLPLDQALTLSHSSIFTTLQARTDPTFSVTWDFGEESCRVRFASAAGIPQDAMAFEDAGTSTPPVAVLQEAAVGPYQAQIIQAQDADALYTWLKDNGYQQDEKARPILGYYIGKGYIFMGLRLQNGKSTGDLRPISLRLGEEAPCVPLRLTGIAATPDMQILVWVLGEARAVPKNHFHAVLNPKAIAWPGATNYVDAVSKAIDTARGHAFVTEFAGPASSFANAFSTPEAKQASSIQSATSLLQVINAIYALNLPFDATMRAILRATVPMPKGLTGFPGYDDGHATTEDEFYAAIELWAQQPELTFDVDLPALKEKIMAEVVRPLASVQGLFDGSKVLTRFFTTVDAEEMTRDPIFAFNPDLPMVSSSNVTIARIGYSKASCGGGSITAEYPNGTKHVFECGGPCFQQQLGPVAGEPTLLQAEVLDEKGGPTPVALSELETIDGFLSLAEAGQPSLPEGTIVTPPSPRPSVTGRTDLLKNQGSSGGCSTGSAPASAAPLALLAMAALLLAWRRRRVG